MDEYKKVQHATEDYVAALEKQRRTREAIDLLKEPRIPEEISCQEDYDFYSGELSNYHKIYRELNDALNMANQHAYEKRLTLRGVIPIDGFNCWFKVEVNGDVFYVRNCGELEVKSASKYAEQYYTGE